MSLSRNTNPGGQLSLPDQLRQQQAEIDHLKSLITRQDGSPHAAKTAAVAPESARPARQSFSSPTFSLPTPVDNGLVEPPAYSNSESNEKKGGFPILGLRIAGHSRLAGHPHPPQLAPLAYEDTEDYVQRENEQTSEMHFSVHPSELDISPRTCRLLVRNFVEKVLPWFPIFDQSHVNSDLVNTLMTQGLEPSSPPKSSALFILALGSFARDRDDPFGNAASDLPGLHYWNYARLMLDARGMIFNLDVVHAWILRA